jgi:hypothetical protein
MTITTTATFGPCTLSTASDDPIIGGTADYQKINPSEGCRGSYAGGSFWETIRWRTAQGKSLVSVVSFSGTRVIDQEGTTEEVKVQASGKVLEGAGVGDTVNMLLDLTDADPAACSSPGGLQAEAGAVSVEFLLPSAHASPSLA